MTQELTPEIIKTLPRIFNPIMVQRKIEKKYELRVFYLDEKFYSSVIFSQSNKKTMIDFRNYDNENPNRVCPFSLP